MVRTGARMGIVVSALLMAAAWPAAADVNVSSLFTDNCILQQGKAVPVWGTAQPAEQVTVTIGEAKAMAAADPNGRWMVKIGPLRPAARWK